MRKLFVLLDRELKSYFYSPVAYIILCFFLALTGFNLYATITLFNGRQQQVLPLEFFFNNAIFWFGYILIIPLITMRLYAEEFKMGTVETLLTAPVRDWQVVASKFLGALVFYMILWAPTVLYFALFEYITKQPVAGSFGAMGASYLLLLLMGVLYLSIGCLASALTQNQIVAAIISLVTLIIIFFTGILGAVLPNVGQAQRDVVAYFSSAVHMQDFTRGIIDSRAVVYYASFAFLLQVVTFQVFQYRKWRA